MSAGQSIKQGEGNAASMSAPLWQNQPRMQYHMQHQQLHMTSASSAPHTPTSHHQLLLHAYTCPHPQPAHRPDAFNPAFEASLNPSGNQRLDADAGGGLAHHNGSNGKKGDAGNGLHPDVVFGGFLEQQQQRLAGEAMHLGAAMEASHWDQAGARVDSMHQMREHQLSLVVQHPQAHYTSSPYAPRHPPTASPQKTPSTHPMAGQTWRGDGVRLLEPLPPVSTQRQGHDAQQGQAAPSWQPNAPLASAPLPSAALPLVDGPVPMELTPRDG